MNTHVRNSTAALQAMDSAHHIHPYSTHKELAAQGPRIVTSANGVYIHDSEGSTLLDGMAGLWCTNVGYGREDLARVGYEALKELPYYNTFFQCTHSYVAELAQKLAEVTPEGMNRVFFANSGSEANDTIFKFVRYYWNLMGKPKKKTIIARNRAYHGVTVAAASLSGLTSMHPQFDLPIPGIDRVQTPYWYDYGWNDDGTSMDEDAFGLKIARQLEERILMLGPDNVGAFIGEPIHGAGGVLMPPSTYWPEINRICKKYDVLLIADEVICGFGRTGNWFGSDTFGIEPDFMTMAKGLSSGYAPISGVMMSDKVSDVIFNSDEEMAHGYTYSGHPVASAIALKNLQILEEEGMIENAGQKVGPYLQNLMREQLGNHPLVGEVRGTGMIGAIELVANKEKREHFDGDKGVGPMCKNYCMENGLVMRACFDIMVFSPPLCLKESEADELVEKFKKSVDQTAKDIGIL